MATAGPAAEPFDGSIPRFYEKYLVPLIFSQYAEDIAGRLPFKTEMTVLETAAGTGVVTRYLASALPSDATLVATDVSQPMLDLGIEIGTSDREVTWRQADASNLPFASDAFDAVVCQFGVMFFSDKLKAFEEARRVLKPGGMFVFNVWDRIHENEFVDTVVDAVARLFPSNPPRFMPETPHGYHERNRILNDLARSGLKEDFKMETVTKESHAETARAVALAYCEGTPLRNEIQTRDASRLLEATDAAELAITNRFGPGPLKGKIQAHVITVRR